MRLTVLFLRHFQKAQAAEGILRQHHRKADGPGRASDFDLSSHGGQVLNLARRQTGQAADPLYRAADRRAQTVAAPHDLHGPAPARQREARIGPEARRRASLFRPAIKGLNARQAPSRRRKDDGHFHALRPLEQVHPQAAIGRCRPPYAPRQLRRPASMQSPTIDAGALHQVRARTARRRPSASLLISCARASKHHGATPADTARRIRWRGTQQVPRVFGRGDAHSAGEQPIFPPSGACGRSYIGQVGAAQDGRRMLPGAGGKKHFTRQCPAGRSRWPAREAPWPRGPYVSLITRYSRFPASAG